MAFDLPRIKQVSKKNLVSKFGPISWESYGRICDVVGTIVEAQMPSGRLGMIAEIEIEGSHTPVLAEVVGFRNNRTLLLPYSTLNGVSPGAVIRAREVHDKVEVGDHLLGLCMDSFLNPFDAKSPKPSPGTKLMPIDRDAPNPMSRARIEHPLSMGIRAIDGLLTFGEGQRIGIMAGSGVGKSVLMGMIAKGSEADVNVIGLIGERGREVREFIERDLGPEGLAKSVVIVVTSDHSPLMRLRGAKITTAIAEYFSSRGKKVLLMMDSLTRVAQAQREIGLAVGEPPTAKGYPPSVYSLLPKLLERCGPQKNGYGSISGLYTVLADGDDFNDPIPDAARSILDGHIELTRKLANQGHFPAIDVTTSVSRVMHDIVTPERWKLASQVKELIAVYKENLDVLQIGGYQHGTNPKMDLAIRLMPSIEAFLKQDINEKSDLSEAESLLVKVLSETGE